MERFSRIIGLASCLCSPAWAEMVIARKRPNFSFKIWYRRLLFLTVLLCNLIFNSYAFADLEFHRYNMSPIKIGEARYDEVFFGCLYKEAAVEIARWKSGKSSRIDSIMGSEERREIYFKQAGCDDYKSSIIYVVELLYKADRKKGELVNGRDGRFYFATYSSSIIRAQKDGVDVYILAHQLVEGIPTEQEILSTYLNGAD